MQVINPLGGGGLGPGKLALATATPADVASGKTFYAGDEKLKTGTMEAYGFMSGTFASVYEEPGVTIEAEGDIVAANAFYIDNGHGACVAVGHRTTWNRFKGEGMTNNSSNGRITISGNRLIFIYGVNGYTVQYFITYKKETTL